MISSRKEANVSKALEELKTDPEIQEDQVQGLTCHVGKAGDRERLVKETVNSFGGLDYLVSNAAANPAFGPALDVRIRIVSRSRGVFKTFHAHIVVVVTPAQTLLR